MPPAAAGAVVIERRVDMIRPFLIFGLLIGFSQSVTIMAGESTKSIPPVPALDLNRYLGTWYEIFRLPHKFEKDLIKVTATYSLRKDGKIKVLNRGYKPSKGKWSDAKGKAWIPDPGVPARLKVSFFWPFSAEYKIIRLDSEYRWALVTSGSTDYLWLLSRTPSMEEAEVDSLMRFAAQNGFNTGKLIRVEQE
jgi:apolipoprotein D and lipocalin family protein